jgi:CRP/FNR family transcriptional regulator, dissimilatory nitrate respiration regulator
MIDSIDETKLDPDVFGVLEKYLEPRTYEAGQVLWTEGEVSGRLVVIERGRVKALRAQPDGRSVLLFVFGPGDVFGFLPFLDGGPYPATAVALDEVSARVMSRSALRSAITKDPQVAMVLLQALGRRLRQAFDRVADQARHDAAARVAAALLLLLPPDAGHGSFVVIEVPSPVYAFAEDMGLTAETFSRAVSRLVDAGVLHRLGSRKLQVLDPDRLRRAAVGGRFDDRSSGNDRD